MEANNSGNATDDHVSSAAALRIRENQRRSRTRRKEYVQHLEQRIWAFERQGVAATQEVQKAARKVSRENELLRSLLGLHGVTEESVEEYLESPTSSTQAQCVSVASLASEKPHLPTAPDQSTSNHHHPLAPSPHRHSDKPPQQPRSIRTRNPSPKPVAETNVDIPSRHQPSPNRAAKPHPVESNSEENQRQNTSIVDGQYMSCVAAARIIEDTPNHSEYRDVRSELGCGSESTCMVKNMSIFDILDK